MYYYVNGEKVRYEPEKNEDVTNNIEEEKTVQPEDTKKLSEMRSVCPQWLVWGLSSVFLLVILWFMYSIYRKDKNNSE